MRPSHHAAAAAISFLPCLAITSSAADAAAFSLATILLDTDHIVDFVLWEKRPLRLSRFFKKGVAAQWPRLIFFFHGYEWIAALAAASMLLGSHLLWAVTAGAAFHLLSDEIYNRLPFIPTRIHAPFYFFSYRLAMGFRMERISFHRP